MQTNTKKLCVLAMMSALAFIFSAFIRVPIVSVPPLVLRYDPKDIIIVIAGFIYGPMAALLVTMVVSLVQMITISATGLPGLFMNIVSSATFCCTAALIYKKDRTMRGALIGLIVGAIFSTAAMLMWNYIVTPIVLPVSREAVVGLLIPVFLPFNLINNSLNAALTMLFYKHARTILRASNLLPQSESGQKKLNIGIIIAAIFIALTCVLWWLFLQDIL